LPVVSDALRLASRWIAVAALACACATASSGSSQRAADTGAPQPTLEQAGGFDRLESIAEGVAWLRAGNRELIVRDPAVSGHQLVVKVDSQGDDADFTVIVPSSKDAGFGKRLQELAFEGPDSKRGGYWREAQDWEDHQVANLVEAVFRRAWQSPITYRVVMERRQAVAS
jgi:hypothetical protein